MMDGARVALREPDHVLPRNSDHSMTEPVDFSQRIRVRGKFLFLGKDKYWVKGVTYGTFKPNERGELFPAPDTVRADFSAMLSSGINTIRTYTMPPSWLLDLALEYGLRVMAGLTWEQHVAFLDSRKLSREIEHDVLNQVRAAKRHPAIMAYAVGNEIPSPIVRWHGRRRIEKFIKRLYRIVKMEDPSALVTYVNYPTTEYLRLDFLDLCCFNVFLEQQEQFDSYLARLQNIAGDRPLMLTEVGQDSLRAGEEAQASTQGRQIRTAFSKGACGTFVFAWTDEWHRGGMEVEDWAFGICRRDRSMKPAQEAVTLAYRDVPFPADTPWPRVSVVVCTVNGANTIRDTLDHLARIDYPDYEVIVVDDGSTDDTAAIVSEYDVSCISIPNGGLGAARNIGWKAASGEIIAYIDDDAYPDPHWLQFLAHAFLSSDCAAVGGLSPAPAGDGSVADCVANAPGRPVHILLTDTQAEHIPGCNMAFRRETMEATGGFDPRYTAAGDDVDICWAILERGWKIGYQAGALNWHHSRNSISAYWRQQKGYGRAEALLEEKWPEKYNLAGHLNWSGRIYSDVYSNPLKLRRDRVYQGRWGLAPFQSIYSAPPSGWSAFPLLPESFFVVSMLLCLALLGLIWPPLLLVLPLLFLSILAPVGLAVAGGLRARFPTFRPNRWHRFAMRLLTSFLFLIQPLARLAGRLRHGLTPWRRRIGLAGPANGRLKQSSSVWSERWQSHKQWLSELETSLKTRRVPLVCGGDFDPWDMEIKGGFLGSARLLMAPEEHGSGKQYLRFLVWPRMSVWGSGLLGLFVLVAVAAALDGALLVSIVLFCCAALLFFRFRYEAKTAALPFSAAIRDLDSISGRMSESKGSA